MSWINKESQNGNSNREKDYPFTRWMSWLFLVASILLLIYTYYRAEITYQGNLNAHYFNYYLISLAGILFWVVVLRLREGIRANIITLAISLTVGLYMVEGGLTFWELRIDSLKQTPAVLAVELGVEYDQRTKLEVIEDLIAQGVDAVTAVRPRDVLTMNQKFLPLGGFSNKTTVGEIESGRYMIYLSDRYGFNNPDSEWDSKEVEWLLTGDSFTEGVAVQPGEDLAGQLRVITQESAINIGRSGNGPLVELAELMEYARAIKPKRVLWFFYKNDLSDLQREKKYPLLIQYMEDGFSQNLINRQKEIDNKLGNYILQALMLKQQEAQEQAQTQTQEPQQTLLYKTRWIRLAEIRRLINTNDSDVIDPLFAKILTKAKSRVESWGGELYFVYLPDYASYKITIPQGNFREKAEVIEVVKGLNIPVIDIHQEVFVDHPDPLALFPFRLSGHYNADGYSEVAKAIVTSVNKYEQSNK
jgi:hypothetical protein